MAALRGDGDLVARMAQRVGGAAVVQAGGPIDDIVDGSGCHG